MAPRGRGSPSSVTVPVTVASDGNDSPFQNIYESQKHSPKIASPPTANGQPVLTRYFATSLTVKPSPSSFPVSTPPNGRPPFFSFSSRAAPRSPRAMRSRAIAADSEESLSAGDFRPARFTFFFRRRRSSSSSTSSASSAPDSSSSISALRPRRGGASSSSPPLSATATRESDEEVEGPVPSRISSISSSLIAPPARDFPAPAGSFATGDGTAGDCGDAAPAAAPSGAGTMNSTLHRGQFPLVPASSSLIFSAAPHSSHL